MSRSKIKLYSQEAVIWGTITCGIAVSSGHTDKLVWKNQNGTSDIHGTMR